MSVSRLHWLLLIADAQVLPLSLDDTGWDWITALWLAPFCEAWPPEVMG